MAGLNVKKIVCGVLQQRLGANAEGDLIQCDEDILSALVGAGVAREATAEDMTGADGDGDEDKDEPLDDTGEVEPPEDSGTVARRLAADAERAVTKAVDRVTAELLAKNRRLNLPAGAHVAGSDFVRTGGFASLGDYALNSLHASKGNYNAIKKMSRWNDIVEKKAGPMFKATAMTVSGSHVGSDLVPQEWSSRLYRLLFDRVPDLCGMMEQIPMKNEVCNIPSWVQQSATSGITANVFAENTAITQTVGATQTVQITLQPYAAMVNVSDQLLRFNSYMLENLIVKVARERIQYQLNNDVIQGTNSGANLLNCAAAVPVVRQTAGHIEYNDITAMMARMYDELADDAVWLTSPSAIPELLSVAFPNRSASTPIPAWTGGNFGDLIGPKPKMELFGKPVYTLENIPPVGSRGALVYVALSNFYAGYWAGGDEVIADYTKAFFFNLLVDSFRFCYYRDSVNALTVPYTRQDGSLASNVVVLTGGSTSSS